MHYLGEPTQQLNVNLDVLSKHLKELLGYAKQTHEALFRSIDVWWKWYHATPATAVRNTPFVNASNLVYPLIKTHADQLHAQRFQALSPASDRFWSHKTYNEDGQSQAKEIVNFVNDEASDRTFDLSGFLYDTTRESNVVGEAIGRLRFAEKERWRFGPSQGKKPVLRKIQVSRGPILEHIPRHQVMWQPGTPIHESPWVIREVPLHRQEILQAVAAMGWDAQGAQKLLRSSPESPALSGLSRLEGPQSSPSRLFAPYRVYEILVEFPMTEGIQPVEDPEAGGKTYPPIMVWMTEDGTILYVGTYPYPTQGWNYYQFTLTGVGRANHDEGLAESLEHFQRGLTTMVNQGNDAVTLHHNLLGTTNDPKLVGKPWVLGQLFLVDSMDSVNWEMRPNAVVQPNIQMMQMLMAGAERLTGISDPGFGRESRMGGHPSPATNFVAMLKQGSLKLAATLQQDRRTLSRLGGDVLALYQAYGVPDESRLIRRYGAKDAETILSWLNSTEPVNERVDFDVRALDESLNPETEFQKQIMVDQLTASYIARVLQALSNIPQAAQQNPQTAQALGEAIKIFTESYRRLLETAQIDDPETFLIRVQELQSGSANAVSRMGAAATGALANLSAANQGAVVPEMPTGIPS